MPALSPYRQLQRNPSFLLFLANCALGALGHGLTYICLAWLSQAEGSSLWAMALVMLGFWAPSLVLAVPIGAFIDRGNERIAAIVANGARGVLLILIALFMTKSIFTSWELFLIASSLGTFNAFYAPSIGVLIRKIVPEELLLYGNSLGDGLVEFFCILGMGTSGLVLGALGLKATLLIAGAMLLSAGFCFVPVRPQHNHSSVDAAVPQIKIPWNDLAKIPNLLIAYTSSGMLFFLMMATPVLLAPYIKALDFTSLFDFSLLEACYSVGAVLGSLLVPVVIVKNKTVSLCLLWMVLAMAYLSFAFFPSSAVWHISYVVIGLCIATWAVVHTELQMVTPLQFQGRLLAYNNALWGGMVFVIFFLSNSLGGVTVLKTFYLGFAVLSVCLVIPRVVAQRFRFGFRLRREEFKKNF